MKKSILLSLFMLVAYASFSQSNVKMLLAKQINELLTSDVDSNLNEIVNVDRLGTINIMYKANDENVDFNILDISSTELNKPDEDNPSYTIVFKCRHCMHLTSPSEERRKQFENSTFTLPVKYKAVSQKIISKLEELEKQNR